MFFKNLQENNGTTAVFLASEGNHVGTLTELLRAKANPDTASNKGTTPVLMACQQNHGEILSSLIEAKCTTLNTPANNSCSPLHISAFKGHLNIVKRLVALKADVNNKSKWGTPLAMASSQNHTDVAQFLSSP